MSKLTEAQVIDVLEDVAKLMAECRGYVRHGFLACDQERWGMLCGIMDIHVIAGMATPMQVIDYLNAKWRPLHDKTVVFKATGISCNLWHFMLEHCRTDKQKSADALRDLADKIEGDGIEVDSVSHNRGARDVPDGHWMRKVPTGEHEITIKYREIQE